MMANAHQLWSRLLDDESGATMVEYGLMLALIAMVAISAVIAIGQNASSLFTANGNAVANNL